MLICTDGSSNGRAIYVVNGERHVVKEELASAQIVELWAIAIVFQFFFK